MIHLGIDGNEANVVNRVGSNHYAYGILQGLYHLNSPEVRITVYLKAAPVPDMPPARKEWQYKVIPPGFAWTQWRLPLELYLPWNRPDVFYSPGHYAPRRAPMPTVVSIMDLAFLKMPNLFLKFKRGTKQLADWTEYSVNQAAAVIAISEHTKKDVAEAYGKKPSDIYVAYPGVDIKEYAPPAAATIKKVLKKYSLVQNYILHLGTLQPRKNIVRLIQAFEQVAQKNKTIQLVLAGQTGWLTEDIDKAIQKSRLKSRIIQTGYVDQTDIPALLAGSQCIALVGLYEGFGMPPAEALAAGTVPVVSKNTSLPEVVGEAGILVDPYSVSSIRHGLMTALEEPPVKRDLRISLGRDHIQRFNWAQSAKIVLEVVQKVVNS